MILLLRTSDGMAVAGPVALAARAGVGGGCPCLRVGGVRTALEGAGDLGRRPHPRGPPVPFEPPPCDATSDASSSAWSSPQTIGVLSLQRGRSGILGAVMLPRGARALFADRTNPGRWGATGCPGP